MSTLRIATRNWWPGCDDSDVRIRFPELFALADFEFVAETKDADILFYSGFLGGRKILRPKAPTDSGPGHLRGGPVRLFYTAENVQPDFRECDFAISFSRDIRDPRHLRSPNSISALLSHGKSIETLNAARPDAQRAAEIRRSKTRFCTYVQGHRVPFREEFVRKLSRYRTVDCAGPSLNNTGYTVDRHGKYRMFSESKFAVTFENEASVGYVTEKIVDAFAMDCVPIYWGDPTVDLDFNPGAFIHVASAGDVDAAIDRVMALDQNDEAYDAMIRAEPFPGGSVPEDYDPKSADAFFRRVVEAARSRPEAARMSPQWPFPRQPQRPPLRRPSPLWTGSASAGAPS